MITEDETGIDVVRPALEMDRSWWQVWRVAQGGAWWEVLALIQAGLGEILNWGSVCQGGEEEAEGAVCWQEWDMEQGGVWNDP